MSTNTPYGQSRSTMPTTRRLALAVLAALCASSMIGAAGAAAAPGQSIVIARAAQLRSGDAVTGALPMQQPIHIEIALKMRDRAGLDALIADNAKKQTARNAPHLMTSAEFLANHAPTQAQAQAVVAYLTSMEFTHITVAPNRMLVSADGTAWTAGNAFTTTFAQVRTRDGRIAFANTDDVRIPAALDDRILAVVGLQTVHEAHAFERNNVSRGQHPLAVTTSHDPTEFPSIYGGSALPASPDISVGLLVEGKWRTISGDFYLYAGSAGLPNAQTTFTFPTGKTSGDIDYLAQWDLNSETLEGMTRNTIGRYYFYVIQNLANVNITSAFNSMVSANLAQVVVASVGECETDALNDGTAAAQDAILETAVAQGQTFSVGTGDAGADECGDGHLTPSWPAASQYVIAAAGTSLQTDSGAWAGETVWSGSGGSESTFEPKPAWQTLWTGSHRGVADVSFDADPASGANIIVNNTAATTHGGTALSAAIFAGAWVRVLQRYPGAGFAGPLLYALPSTDFHDVTSGSNGNAAAAGYDLASGRGSMLLDAAVADAVISQGPVAKFGYSATGTTVKFNDQSTDTSSTITTYSWDFGDGSTSSLMSPKHVFASFGPYIVRETITDNYGASSSNEKTLTPGGLQLLKNTGFESGKLGAWSTNEDAGTALLHSGIGAHTGEWYFGLGSTADVSHDHLSQTVTIPTGFAAATLAFYLQSEESSTFDAKDPVKVQVWSGTQFLATLATYSNAGFPSGWVKESVDMTPYIGQTVTIKFLKIHFRDHASYWAFDDATLVVH